MHSRLRCVHEPQKRQDLAHRFVRVKRHLPNRLIGNAGTLKCFDQKTALRAQAVEHSEIGKRASRDLLGAFDPARVQREIARAAHHLLDLVHDKFSLSLVSRRLDYVKLNLIRKLHHRLDCLQPRPISSFLAPCSPLSAHRSPLAYPQNRRARVIAPRSTAPSNHLHRRVQDQLRRAVVLVER